MLVLFLMFRQRWMDVFRGREVLRIFLGGGINALFRYITVS
jgi:hypothetical protein